MVWNNNNLTRIDFDTDFDFDTDGLLKRAGHSGMALHFVPPIGISH